MSDLFPMPLDTSAYLSDTGHLSTLEHGAYQLILMAMWRSKDGWLDGSDHYLARATRMTLGRWKRIAPTIRSLLTTDRGRVTQKRLQKTRRAQAFRAEETIPAENPNREAKPLKNKGLDSERPRGGESALLLLPTESEPRGPKKGRKTSGRILPPDWKPSDEERLYGRTVLRLTDGEINSAAEKMRRWAIGNQHRAVARKSDWNITFRNWLDGDAERKHARNGNGHAPRPGSREDHRERTDNVLRKLDDFIADEQGGRGGVGEAAPRLLSLAKLARP